ncbi:LacI family DNA-binding transcriptional regulator [Microbacterium halotolerans]|uniref:LacI family DNA-binding transcriptional regulator n=1 Tax=Microbacterium halotolerans TaxID=246613 RepID=UPI001F09258E|nr:LacI family DNA-binding transcriptional regulator [Microbacterium halotolerans]
MKARRVTQAGVAHAAGVSRSTASLVLSGRGDELRISGEVQRRVRQVALELGYRPNLVSAGLRDGTSRTIGFLSDTIATSQLAGDMIRGALAEAHRAGYMLFIGESEGDIAEEERLVDAMLDRQVDAVVIASMFTRERGVSEAARGRAVLLNALPEHGIDVAAVVPDEYDAGRRSAERLLAAGHRRIHLIGVGLGEDEVPPETVAGVERRRGILDALGAVGVTPESGRLCRIWLPDDGWKATRDLLASGVDGGALITFNDRLAFGAYQALHEAGLTIPDDFSMVSFDDHQLAGWLHPGLTTFAIPHYELGERAVRRLLTDEGPTGGTERIAMPLVERGSIAEHG